ncbi:MAG TPA: Rieske (2Fe-2S) protein [Polyangia bacterium]|nr:Rieske (2Fe-2S) protein [Polyangia bacterium]
MSGCSRRTFNLVACGAAVELWACGTSLKTLTPSGNVVTLSYAEFPQLASPGGSAVVAVSGQFPLAVVRTDDATAVALSATCTHAGCTLEYAPERTQLHCNCHDANFTLDGAVVSGPTVIPLPVYPATPGADAITVDLR